MAYKLPVSGRYGTHLPLIIKAIENTKGDMLELGMGLFSTPYMHYQAILRNRLLVSYENDAKWAQFFFHYGYECKNHEIHVVEKYADAKIEKTWDVVLIDQTPDTSRIEEVKRLVNRAKYIIIHDSNDNMDNIYHYSEISPLFKYHKVWDMDSNHATVLSNFVDLKDFWL